MIAVVYARVSSEDQARSGFSLASQVDFGRRRAQELGAAEIATYADEGVPGDVLERPGLQGALDAVRRGGVALFVCYDPDRLARSLSLQLLVTDQIERAGTRLEFVNFDYKNTPEGQLFYSLRGAIAQFEKAKIRERTMRGKRQKAKEGGLTHNPCLYGYDFDPVTDRLTVNEEEARVVRLIFHWFLTEDLGPGAIARRLTDLGIQPQRAGKAWHHASVRNILRNQSYTGVLHQQKWDYTDTNLNKYRAKGQKVKRKLRPASEWIPIAIPPIIDAHQHEAARAKLANARRWWSGWHREEYLLKGLCTCGACGRPVCGASRSSGGSRIRYYVCRGYAPGCSDGPRCAFGRVRADQVEEAVWGEVKRLVLMDGALERVFTRQNDEFGLRNGLALYRKQLAEAEAEHERTVRLMVKGTIDQTLGDGLIKEQQQRIAHLKEQAARVERQVGDMDAENRQAGEIEQLRRRYAPIIRDLPFEVRQQAVRAVVKGVQITREETGINVHLTTLKMIDQEGVC